MLLSRPTPCLALFAILVDPSLVLVNLNNESYVIPNDVLPSSDDARWAGAVNLSARSVWCDTGPALSGLRISTFGALRPRGAGTAAPSTEIIRVLISRAGAIVTDERPDIVLVAPGLSRKGAKIQKLLAKSILCLGAGFIVDLLLRLHANPQEYLAFPEQQALCGPLIDANTARTGRPLPVSKAVLTRSVQSNLASPVADAKPTVLRQSTRVRKRHNNDEAECEQDEKTAFSSENGSYLLPKPYGYHDGDAHVPTQNAHESFITTSPTPTLARHCQHETPREERRRKRNAQTQNSKDEEVTPEYEHVVLESTGEGIPRSTPEAASAPSRATLSRIPRTSADEVMKAAIHSDAPTRELQPTEVGNGQQFGVDTDFEPSQSLIENTKGDLQPRSIILPVTPSQNPPKRIRLDSGMEQVSSTFQDMPRNTRSNLKTVSDSDMSPRRQLRYPGSDLKPKGGRASSHSSRSLFDSSISRKVDRNSFSVNDGFRFLFARLGEPLQSDIDRLFRSIRSREEVDPEKETAESNPQQGLIEGELGPAHGSHPRDAESPLLDDEDDLFLNFDSTLKKEDTSEEAAVAFSSTDLTTLPTASRSNVPKREAVDAFRIPVPTGRTILSNVISPQTATFDRASEISIVNGHDVDDKNCQHVVGYVDWILGADNFVSASRDALHASPLFSRSRKLWSSLFESNALRRLAAPVGLPDADIGTLTGVCIRLIASGASDDTKKMLAAQLLSVRDEQIRTGFDSLQDVLMSGSSINTSFHHKCVGAIWTCLLQSCTVNGDFSRAWEVLNNPLISRVDAIFSSHTLRKSQHSLEKELTKVLRATVALSYMFSTQLDVHVCDEWKDVDPDDSVLHPENWRMIYYCMDKLCDLGQSHKDLNMVLAASTSLLRSIVINIGGKAWPITDTLVARTSQMIASLSSLSGKICFCDLSSAVFENLWTAQDGKNVTAMCSGSLKTMCDSFFLLAWLFTIRGQGSPVKRAMTVIRTGSFLNRVNETCPGLNTHFINHHVGLLMTLADSLANSSRDGEYLVCKMLASKCPRPAAIAGGKSTQTGDQDACWRATLLAVQKRCQILLSRGQSMQHYINWLSQNLVESLGLMRRSPGRRSASLSEKETMRAQDSVLCSLAILIIESLIEVNRPVLASLQRDHTLRRKLKSEDVGEPAKQISTYVKVSGELISQIRSSPEESESKNRYGLLQALFSLMNCQVLLVRHIIASPLSTERGSDVSVTRTQWLDEGALSFIEDRSTETVILQTICGRHPSGGILSGAGGIYKAAAGLLANLIELRTIRGEDQIKRGENLVAILQQANMDVTVQLGSQFKRTALLKRQQPPAIEDSYRLVFWSEAVQCTWMVGFLQQRRRSQVICVSAILSLLVCMADDWSVEDRATTIRLSKKFTNLWPLRHVFAPIRSEIDGLDIRETSLSRVSVVEKSLRILIKHWPVEEVRNLLQFVHSRLKHVVGSTAGIEPDALILYSFSHTLSAQLRGFNQARVLHIPLGDIAYAVSRMTNSSRDHSKTFHMVQVRVLSALSMVPSDMETRVLVLRVVNAFPAYDALSGFWGAALLPTGEVPETWTKRAEKYAQDWRNFVFISVIEDPLFSGRSVGCVTRRLAAASKGDEALRRLVQSVLVRGRGRLDLMLRRDGRAWREWSALCDELLEGKES